MKLADFLNNAKPNTARPIDANWEWSVRAKHALEELGVTTLAQLAGMDGRKLQAGRNIGAATLREIAAALVHNSIRPRWIADVKPQFLDLATSQPDESKFVEIAGPYGPGERWMLELAIAQLGTIEWCVRLDISITNSVQHFLYRAKAGYKQTQPEEEK